MLESHTHTQTPTNTPVYSKKTRSMFEGNSIAGLSVLKLMLTLHLGFTTVPSTSFIPDF